MHHLTLTWYTAKLCTTNRMGVPVHKVTSYMRGLRQDVLLLLNYPRVLEFKYHTSVKRPCYNCQFM